MAFMLGNASNSTPLTNSSTYDDFAFGSMRSAPRPCCRKWLVAELGVPPGVCVIVSTPSGIGCVRFAS